MDEQNHNEDQGRSLDRLIHDAGELHSEAFTRPSDVTIDVYLLGTANERQKKEIQSALRASSGFRRELLEMATDIERLKDPETRNNANGLRPESLPPFPAEFLESAGSSHAHLPDYQGLMQKLSLILKRRWFVPAVGTLCVAVLATILSLWHGAPEVPGIPSSSMPDSSRIVTLRPMILVELSLIDGNVAPAVLASNLLRSAVPLGSTDNSRWSDSTALQAIRTLLDLDPATYRFRILPAERVNSQSNRGSESVLQFVDSVQTSVEQMTYHLPPGADSITVWVLGLTDGPKYLLYAKSLSGDSNRVLWTRTMGGAAIATITFRSNGRYHAIATSSFIR